MNIYEDKQLDEKFHQITDLIGYLLLDFIAVSLMKVKCENNIFKDLEETRMESLQEEEIKF